MGWQGKIKQGKLIARRRRRLFYLCLYTVAAAGLLLSFLSYISGLEPLLVNEIAVSGNSRLASTTIQSVALQDLGGTYWYLFPRSNTLLYPRAAIERDILTQPVVKTATVNRSSMRTISIIVTERQTAALWCGQGITGEASRCYSVDDNGFIFAPRADADHGFMYTGTLASSTLPAIGQSILVPTAFKKIEFFMAALKSLSIQPEKVQLAASSSYMTIVLGGGGKLIVNSADELSGVLGNISAIISDKTVAPSLPVFLQKLDYMKLDVGNKVVFKLR